MQELLYRTLQRLNDEEGRKCKGVFLDKGVQVARLVSHPENLEQTKTGAKGEGTRVGWSSEST